MATLLSVEGTPDVLLVRLSWRPTASEQAVLGRPRVVAEGARVVHGASATQPGAAEVVEGPSRWVPGLATVPGPLAAAEAAAVGRVGGLLVAPV